MSQPAKEGKSRELLQWHPAFYAGIQIEFGEEAAYLDFKQEYPLGTKPKQIDVLIKKDQKTVLRKNIGRIFRTHNIIEYKGPGDYHSVDDFYKVCGYVYFYKSQSPRKNAIPFDELTVSLVSESYPRELIRHLRQDRGYQVREMESGIYYVTGDALPIQIIVTRKLSEKENLWLRSLTNRLESAKEAEILLREYQKHKKNLHYESVMEIIVQANAGRFEEVKEMCRALEELMKDELEASEKIGKEQGQQRVNELVLRLSRLGRVDDIVKAAGDREYQETLFQEFGL